MVLTPDALDDIMVALSDKTRRSILERLFEGEARVTDLARPFDMSLNSVSKHIRILERAKLVTRRKSGRDHFLSFNAEPFQEATSWMKARAGGDDGAEKSAQLDNFTALMKAEAETKKKRWSLWGV